MTTIRPENEVTAAGAGTFTRVAHRSLGERQESAAVTIRAAQAPDAAKSPLAGLAGARAWLALGRKAVAAKEFDGAAAAARKGLHDLGEDDAPHGVEDDTELKVLAAEALMEQGKRENGSAMLLRMLESRTQLAARKHAGEIAE